MTDPDKKVEPSKVAPPAPDPSKGDTDLPDDLKRGPEPEGDIEKMVERGRQMGF